MTYKTKIKFDGVEVWRQLTPYRTLAPIHVVEVGQFAKDVHGALVTDVAGTNRTIVNMSIPITC
jgi:hypothetical protein